MPPGRLNLALFSIILIQAILGSEDQISDRKSLSKDSEDHNVNNFILELHFTNHKISYIGQKSWSEIAETEEEEGIIDQNQSLQPPQLTPNPPNLYKNEENGDFGSTSTNPPKNENRADQATSISITSQGFLNSDNKIEIQGPKSNNLKKFSTSPKTVKTGSSVYKYPVVKLPFGLEPTNLSPMANLTLILDINSRHTHLFNQGIKKLNCSSFTPTTKPNPTTAIPNSCLIQSPKNDPKSKNCSFEGFWPIKHNPSQLNFSCSAGKTLTTVFNHSYLYTRWWNSKNLPLAKMMDFMWVNASAVSEVDGVLGLAPLSDYANYNDDLYLFGRFEGIQFQFLEDLFVVMPDVSIDNLLLFRKKVVGSLWAIEQTNVTLDQKYDLKGQTVCLTTRTNTMVMLGAPGQAGELRELIFDLICPKNPKSKFSQKLDSGDFEAIGARNCPLPTSLDSLGQLGALNFSFFSEKIQGGSKASDMDRVTLSLSIKDLVIPAANDSTQADLSILQTPENFLSPRCQIILGTGFLNRFPVVFSQSGSEEGTSELLYFVKMEGTDFNTRLILAAFVNVFLMLFFMYSVCRITWVYRNMKPAPPAINVRKEPKAPGQDSFEKEPREWPGGAPGGDLQKARGLDNPFLTPKLGRMEVEEKEASFSDLRAFRKKEPPKLMTKDKRGSTDLVQFVARTNSSGTQGGDSISPIRRLNQEKMVEAPWNRLVRTKGLNLR